MKKRVVERLIFTFIFLIFLSAGVFAAAPTSGKCAISSRAECTGNGNHIIMDLSSSTNAHGEFPDAGTYSYVLCCALGTGDKTCIGSTNKLIGLSSITNAHAQSPLQTTYTNKVCYEDFDCVSTTTPCSQTNPPRPLEIMSLTSETNAHIGNINDYPIKVCCGSPKFEQCSLKSAVWNIENAIEGQRVYLQVAGDTVKCSGLKLSFEVREDDVGSYSSVEIPPLDVSFNGDKAVGAWIAEYQDDGILGGDPEYSFNATLVRNPPLSIISSNQLSVTKTVLEDYCADKTVCSDYTNEGECESDATLCALTESSSLPEVDCDSADTMCGCSWDNETNVCGFSWSKIEDCGSPSTGGCNYGCTLCSNSTGDYCNVGAVCPEGETPTDNQNGTCDFGEGCLSPNDCNNGDKDSCAQGLFCSLGKCFSFEELSENIINIGGCKITQTIEKDCDEEPVGYKIVTWSGTWTGNETSGEAYEKCIAGGRSTVSCPAQIQLPFFDYYEIILTIGIIAVVYISLMFRRKFLKKTSHKKKKR